MRHIILSWLILFLSVKVFSLQPLVRNFTRYDYKSGTQNWSITQDSANIMFFANNFGLLRFDGKNWNTFPIINRTSIHSVFFSGGRIYASTFNEFGYFQKSENDLYKYESLLHKFNLNINGSNEIYKIVQGNGKIYFQSENYIFVYNGDTLISLPFYDKIQTSAFIHDVYFISSLHKGVFMLNGSLFFKIPDSEILSNKRICAMLPINKNDILFVTSFDGVYLYNGASITPYNTGIDDFLKKNQVFCATTDGKKLFSEQYKEV